MQTIAINLGKVAIAVKGNYDPNANYEKLDLVYYQDGTYIAVAPVVNEAPNTSDKWQLLVSSGNPLAIQAAVDNYMSVHGVENLVYEALDFALSNDPQISSPKLTVDNTVDPIYNPVGHYILYYIDSDEVRHNIFDFSEVFYTKEEIDAMLNNP